VFSVRYEVKRHMLYRLILVLIGLSKLYSHITYILLTKFTNSCPYINYNVYEKCLLTYAVCKINYLILYFLPKTCTPFPSFFMLSQLRPAYYLAHCIFFHCPSSYTCLYKNDVPCYIKFYNSH